MRVFIGEQHERRNIGNSGVGNFPPELAPGLLLEFMLQDSTVCARVCAAPASPLPEAHRQ
jgi:hypothetical protein